VGQQPHVYVMMVKDRPELTVVHQVMHFTPPMGGEVQPWQNKVITWTGDVHPQALYLPKQSFTVFKGMKVWTDFKAKLLDLEEAGGLLPAVGDLAEDDRFEEVNTRQAMFVPSELAALFLEKSLTPKQAYFRVEKVVEDNDLETENKPLLDWLKVACMQDGPTKIQ